MAPDEPDFTSPPLLVSSLGVNLDSRFGKNVQSITLEAGDIKKELHYKISPGAGHRESFSPPLEIVLGAKFSVSVHYSKPFKRGIITITMDPREILYRAQEDSESLYHKTEKKVEVIIGVQSLHSTVTGVIASCSKFRLLIIGDTGVGKSSLINKVFKVNGVHVSNTTRGKATIDQEHIASDNSRFIVHDSCGFEAADSANLETVRKFILNRRRMPDLKDQLHAIWLCLEIPHAGGRLLQAGVEEFLKKRGEILENVPLVVVCTKLDLLVNKLKVELLERDESPDEETLRSRRLESLDRLCSAPIRKVVGSDCVPHISVSSMEGYEETLSSLVEMTTKNIQTYVKDEAAHYIATIAQRINISLKISLTIAVGERRYWKTLMASPNFSGHTIKACLDVIHGDIIAVWNLNDPDRDLIKDGFKALLLSTPDLRVREAKDVQKTMRSGVGLIAALVTIITAVAGTGGLALPIVVPAAGAAILAKIAYDLYKASQDVARQLMAYIVDLTCVIQIIFLLVSSRSGSCQVNAEVINTAMGAYQRTHRCKIHQEINAFSVNLAVAPGKCDRVLEKIKELIKDNSIGDDALTALRQQLQSSD